MARLVTAVVGGGVMGAATAWHLARRGHAVAVFEQFARGHDRGSSHGNARIFRLAYPEPEWTALARESLPQWHRLEADADVRIIHPSGGIDHGRDDLLARIAATLADLDVAHRMLDAAAARVRWPGLAFESAVLFHPDAGPTDAALAVATLLAQAERHGAVVRDRTPVRAIEPVGDRVTVRLDGEAVTVDSVVVTPGAWAAGLLDGLVDLPSLTVTMEQPAVFAPRVAGPTWPTFVHWTDAPPRPNGVDEPVLGYGLGTPDGRVKVGEHHTGRVIDPDRRPDAPDPDRTARLLDHVARWVPGVDPASAQVETCLYTSTPTTDFVVRRVGPVVVGAGFSGHGFKFAPRIGEVLADLVEGGRPPAVLDRA